MEPARARGLDFKPHLFGKFFLLQRLAVGGMAEIYRAKVMTKMEAASFADLIRTVVAGRVG